MENIIVEQKDQFALITLSRPKALNALNRATLEELSKAVDELAMNRAVRALILTGAGEKAFVAGADISSFPSLGPSGAKEFAEFGQMVFAKLEALKFPVIAAVNGFALGGGLELALACDFIFASENAKFALPECKLGLIPGFGGTVRLPRRVGTAFALELAMSGEMISADRALSMGLVNRVLAKDQLLSETMNYARIIASRAPIAIASIKQQIHQTAHLSVEEACRNEAQRFGQIFGSQDAKRGVNAFLNSQSVEFQGD